VEELHRCGGDAGNESDEPHLQAQFGTGIGGAGCLLHAWDEQTEAAEIQLWNVEQKAVHKSHLREEEVEDVPHRAAHEPDRLEQDSGGRYQRQYR
jgi:hypothetical protein